MKTTMDQQENMSVEEAQEEIRRLEKYIEECCNVATPYVKWTLDSCYSDTEAITIDITAKILADFESWQGSGKLIDVIVNLMNWYRPQRPNLNLIFQPDALDNPEGQQLVRWSAQKATALRSHPYNDSYPYIRIHFERETKRLGILCSAKKKIERPAWLTKLANELLIPPHMKRIAFKDLSKTYLPPNNLYMLKQHLKKIPSLLNYEVITNYASDYIIISLKSKNNS
jgi:hypothetical protein